MMKIGSKLFPWWIAALIVVLSWCPVGAESAEELLEELRELREEVEKRRTELQKELKVLRGALGTKDGTSSAETEISEAMARKDLEELHLLQEEVVQRRIQLHQELEVLKEALGTEAEAVAPEQMEFVPGAMSWEELEAELRILREELALLKAERPAAPEALSSASTFQVKGQVRTRFEWNDNDFASGNANLVHLLRSRIDVAGAPQEHTRVLVQAQDARLWGEEASTLADGNADNIDFHQAYIHLDKVFSYPLSIRLGRQEIIYGGQRLIGAVGWHNIGRSFDAIKLRYGGRSFVDVFNAKLTEKGMRDRNFFGLYGHIKSADQVAWEPYLLFEHDKNSGAGRMKRATLGVHATGDFAGATGHSFGYEVESAYQTGDLGVQNVNAWMATGALSYTSPSWYRHKVVLGADVLSGDDDPAAGDYKVFDTLFATNHKFYGFMDFFLNIPANTGQQGLVDLMLKGEMKVAANAKLALHLHNFSLFEGNSKKLGQEVDAIFSYSYNKACAIQWGGLLFVPDDGMKTLKGNDDLAFKTYVQTRVNF